MLYFGKKKIVYSDFMQKRTTIFLTEVLEKEICDALLSKVKKAKSGIKTPIIFLDFKAKDVSRNLHFVVPIFCAGDRATFQLICVVPELLPGEGKESFRA